MLLNRIYIFVGTLIILGLVAAFALPSLVNWQQYRGNIEQAASDFFGQQVRLRGNAEFRLLPSPRFEFLDVHVGQNNTPLATAGRMQIDLDLIDFLQDQFTVTDLILSDAALHLSLDRDGQFTKIFSAQDGPFAQNLLIEKISIDGGRLHLYDARDGTRHRLDNIAGQARIAGPRGPFSFQGNAQFIGTDYAVRFSSDQIDENKVWPISVGAQPRADAALAPEQSAGLSLTGEVSFLDNGPRFEGKLNLRTKPLLGAADQVVGAAPSVLNRIETEIAVSPNLVRFSALKWWPDQAKQTAFFEGAADIGLGRSSRFDAALTTKVLDLQGGEESTADLVAAANRLAQLQLPIIATPGRVNVKADRIKVDGVDLRDVELMLAHAKTWEIKQASFALPGGNIGAYIHRPDPETNRLPREAGRLAPLNGDFALSIGKLDALARSFGKTDISPFLLGVEGLYSAQVRRRGALLVTENGRLNFGETSGALDVRYDFARDGNPNIKLNFSRIDSNGIETLLALMPDMKALDTTSLPFESGVFELTIDKGDWAGLDIEKFGFLARWAPNKLQIERLEAAKFGQSSARIGANLGKAFGENQTVTFNVAADDLVGLNFLNGKLEGFTPLKSVLKPVLALNQLRHAPDNKGKVDAKSLVPFKIETGIINLDIDGEPTSVTLSGDVAGTQIERLKFSVGAPVTGGSDELNVKGTARLKNNNGNDLLKWLGAREFVPATSAQLDVAFEGDMAKSLAVDAQLQADQYQLQLKDGFWHACEANASSEQKPIASGTLEFNFADGAPLLSALLGVDAQPMPLEGSAQMNWQQTGESIKFDLDNVQTQLNKQAVLGSFSSDGAGDGARTQIILERADISDIAAALLGEKSRERGAAVWPVGGLTLLGKTDQAKSSKVSVKIGALALTDTQIVTDAILDMALSEGTLTLQRLRGGLDGGTIEFTASSCCVGGADTLSVKGKLVLENVPLQNFIFESLQSSQKGLVSLNGEFETIGSSLEELVKSLSGKGAIKLQNLELAGLDPAGFVKAKALEDVAQKELDEVTKLVAQQFEGTKIAVGEISSPFSLVGGVARINALDAEFGGLHVKGQASLNVQDLKLEGRFDIREIRTGEGGVAHEPVKTAIFGASVKPRTAFDFSHFAQSLKQAALDAEIKKLEEAQAVREAAQNQTESAQ